MTSMWKLVTRPDLLIYLDVSWHIASQRRRIDAREGWWAELARRLQHARQHADIYIDTDNLRPPELVDRAIALIDKLATLAEDGSCLRLQL